MIVLLFLSVNLSLDQAIDKALMNSYLYLRAKKNLLIQQKTNSFIYSDLLPQIYGGYDYSRSHSIATGMDLYDTTSTYSVSLSWNLKPTDFLDAYSTHYKNSSAYSYFQEMRDEVIFQAVTSYLNSFMMDELLQSKEKAVERTRNNFLLVKEKLRLGSASRAELLKSEVDYKQSQYELLRARKDQRVARLKLTKLIGMDPTDSLVLHEPSIEFELPAKDSIHHLALLTDPTLNMYRSDVRSAKLDLLSNTTNQLFSLSLSGNYGYSGEDFPSSSVWDDGDHYSIGVSITVPIFTGFSRVNSIMLSRLKLSLAELELSERERDIRISVVDIYLGYRESMEKVELTRIILELAKESYKAAEERYRLGEASIIELLVAEEDLLQAHYSVTQAKFDYYLAIYKLKRLMGRLP